MAAQNQTTLILHIKNKLRERAAELFDSRNSLTSDEIKSLLENRYGDIRDLSALIQDLERMIDLSSESSLTFEARLQSHGTKMSSQETKQDFQKKASPNFSNPLLSIN